ncbi:hypothetical protein LVISKB_P9-0001 (plasmid) [Levilactobacillus brevis KB290]|uniref:Uncharacterized protein n=1 Tax=Levilactobacillus brevis KB290 TaxID=1001583 RepID=M5AIL3_LEVBR|nr:hypothetical protein LVISKB_P9-0001 [Levilactobacillus brevis KB290]
MPRLVCPRQIQEVTNHIQHKPQVNDKLNAKN